MTIELRPLRDGDAPFLLDLHRRSIAAVPDALVAPDLRESWAAGLTEDVYVTAAADGETFLIAEEDGRIVGFLSFRDAEPHPEIVGLYVDPAAQSRGVARRLVEAAERDLARHEAGAIRAVASPAGEGAWTALGYRVTERWQHRTRGGRDIPVAILEKLVLRPVRPHRNFYGRRKGHALKDVQERYLDEDLAALSPGAVDWDANPDRAPLDLDGLFGGRDVWLEVGFGGGEHMVHQAARNPDIGIIGCEPYINGVAMLLGKIRRAGVDNLAVHPDDVRDLFDVLPDESIARAFLLYPDPWPKARHHRRRFVTQEHLEPLFRALKPGAEFRVATDIEDYVRQTLEEVPRSGFVPEVDGAPGWHEPWADWLPTRYERKALREGRTPHYLTFRKP